MVKLEPGTAWALARELSEMGLQSPIRINLVFTGCCDPSLGLRVDAARESDLVEETDGLCFVMTGETHELVGEVTISHVDEPGRKGFALTSSRPVSEWEGFALCRIRT
jgi:Fe-S cluster assembly iron-binding protein IscA